MYLNRQDVIDSLLSGDLSPRQCQLYTHNKNLRPERRQMFKTALIQYRILELQAKLKQVEEETPV